MTSGPQSQLARLSSLDLHYTTPADAKAIANGAADAYEKLFLASQKLIYNGSQEYAVYLEEHCFMFAEGLRLTYTAAILGSEYFVSFKEQISDKWQETPWDAKANQGYMEKFLKDPRGSTLNTDNKSIDTYFDKLPIEMKKLRIKINDPDVQKELGPTFDSADGSIGKVDGFGKSWNTFPNDVALIRDMIADAEDFSTQTYLTKSVKTLADLSKTLSEALGIYAKVLKDSGILIKPKPSSSK